jgi:dipeptidyl aminopeptidase/acylaminoacyl peptidase
MLGKLLLTLAFALVLPASSFAEASLQTVTFPSGKLTLGGVLYKPEGKGPFPAVVYNHGSAPGMLSNEAFEALGPVFVRHGWIFFAPYRRGQGLSQAAGTYIGDQIARARKKGLQQALLLGAIAFLVLTALLFILARKQRLWVRVLGLALLLLVMAYGVYWNSFRAASAELVRVLETDQLDDQVAAYDWLRRQDFTAPNRIAVAGNSFGGIETVLGAERLKYCAALDASGGAESWSLARQLRVRMTQAVRNSQAPVFFFQAENDYNLAPSRVLSAVMKEAGKQAEMKIYPAFGQTSADGHSFVRMKASVWADDAFQFLEKYCIARP